MFKRQKDKRPYDQRIAALDEGAQGRALAAMVVLRTREPELKRLRVLPKQHAVAYMSVVAQTIESFIVPPDERTSEYSGDLAHCLRDVGTVLAGSQLVDGPYGDLLLRSSVGANAVVVGLHVHDTGDAPYFEPEDVVPPPHLLTFLNRFSRAFAEAMSASAPRSWPEGAYTEAVYRLAGGSYESCHALVAETGAMQRLKGSMYPPQHFSYDDMVDMTGDETLAQLASGASPV